MGKGNRDFEDEGSASSFEDKALALFLPVDRIKQALMGSASCALWGYRQYFRQYRSFPVLPERFKCSAFGASSCEIVKMREGHTISERQSW